MSQPRDRTSTHILGPLGVLGIGALAVACCIGLPLLVAAIGGLALAAVIGVAAGVAASILLLAAIMAVRSHRRRDDVRSSPEPSR